MLYPAAKIIIEHPTDPKLILLVKRHIQGHVYYEPAGGKLEVDFTHKQAESLEACAQREAEEELGLKVSVDRYIGSYYFFWTTDPNKCCSCAVFLGTIIDSNSNFTGNIDICELAIEPVWVAIEDLLQKRIEIDPLYVGLEELVINYCQKKMIS